MAELTTCLQDEVTDLAELQHAHMQYLAQTHHHCLMSQSTRDVRAIIEPVLQCIVEFANNCRYVYETQICSRPTVIPVARHQLSSNAPHYYGADSECSTCNTQILVPDVYLHCRSSGNSISDMQDLLQDQGRWSCVHKSIQEFQLRTSVLYKVLKYASGRGHYQELFVQLDFNKYYGTDLS